MADIHSWSRMLLLGPKKKQFSLRALATFCGVTVMLNGFAIVLVEIKAVELLVGSVVNTNEASQQEE